MSSSVKFIENALTFDAQKQVERHVLNLSNQQLTELKLALQRPYLSVRDVGKLLFGLRKSAAYEASADGRIPTIRVRGKILVPVDLLLSKLAWKNETLAEIFGLQNSEPTNAATSRADDRGDDKPIWGLQNIAKEIGLTINAAYPKIRKGLIPARQVGDSWVSTKGELRRLIRGEVA